MVSTYTTNKGLEKPAYNDYVDDWNTPVNGNSDFIDSAFGGSTSLNATAASGTVSLTATQYRTPILLISGTLTANVNYQIPSGKGGLWAVYNNTTGAFTITISSAGGGTTVVIPQTSRQIVYCDGTNVAPAQNYAPGVTTNVTYNNGGVLAGSNTFVFDGTNVGINTTTPGARLDVKGAVRLSGSTSGYVGLAPAAAAGSTTYTLPSSDGTAGQMLTTNGSGVMSWQSGATSPIPSGTKMLFVQTAAPTGWTKDTTHNNKALRVVSGAASTGGTVDFTVAFAAQTATGTTDGTAITSAQMPSHQHFVAVNQVDGNNLTNTTYIVKQRTAGGDSDYDLRSSATAPTLGLTSSTGSGNAHTHTFTSNAIDLAVAYVDVIIATRD